MRSRREPWSFLGSSGRRLRRPLLSLPIPESQSCTSVNMYGLTKLAAEHITRVKAARCGIASVTARIFNVVGPGRRRVMSVDGSPPASAPSEIAGACSRSGRWTRRGISSSARCCDRPSPSAQAGERGGTYNVASGRATPTVHPLRSCSASRAWTGRSDRPTRRPPPGVQATLRGRVSPSRAWIVPNFSLTASFWTSSVLFRGCTASESRATIQLAAATLIDSVMASRIEDYAVIG